MKNRKIPLGYEMKNGKIVIHKIEANIVSRIYTEYLGGQTLNAIADRLREERIEYFTGVSDWNKSRIKRILEDIRYVGDTTYPQLISADIQNKVKRLKDSKYNGNKTSTQKKTEYRSLYDMVYCIDCGSKMIHRTDSRYKASEKYTCQNDNCHSIVTLSTEELTESLTKLLNLIISGKINIIEESVDNLSSNLEIKRIENEIERILSSLSIDKVEAKNLILECVAKKYQCIKSARHITEKLKVDFMNKSPLSCFNIDLFNKTVAQIFIDKALNISVRLKNGQFIGKEYINYANSST